MDLLNLKPNVVSKGVEGKHFLFFGHPSTYKTTVACKFPDTLLLATEIGYSMIPGVLAYNISNWAQFRKVVRELKKPELKAKFKTIAIDTVGLLTDMCLQYICATNNVEELSQIPWGKGWTDYKREFRNQLNAIAQEGYGIVLIAHANAKTNEDGRIVSALPQMDKQTREAVVALVDFIFFLQKEPKSEGSNDTTVFAYSDLPSTIESKSRARYLSRRFEFTFENLESELIKAVEKFEQESEGSVTDKVINLYEEKEKEKVPFETLKEETIALAKALISREDAISAEAANAIQKSMQGIRLNDTTPAHYKHLENLQELLIEIKEKVE